MMAAVAPAIVRRQSSDEQIVEVDTAPPLSGCQLRFGLDVGYDFGTESENDSLSECSRRDFAARHCLVPSSPVIRMTHLRWMRRNCMRKVLTTSILALPGIMGSTPFKGYRIGPPVNFNLILAINYLDIKGLFDVI